MKRVLCAALLGAAAFATVPAEADPGLDIVGPKVVVRPIVWTEPNRVGVGATYDFGHGEQPLGGAWVDPTTGKVCVGFSYQIPVCAGGDPIE